MKYIVYLVLSAFVYQNACADIDTVTKEIPTTTSMHLVQQSPSDIFYKDVECAQEWIRQNKTAASYLLHSDTLDVLTTSNIENAVDAVFGGVASAGLRMAMGVAMASTLIFVPEDLMASTLTNIHQTFSNYIESPTLAKSAGTFVTVFGRKMTEWAQKTVVSKAINTFKDAWVNPTDSKSSLSTVGRFGSSCRGLWDKFKDATVKTVRSAVHSTVAPFYLKIKTLFA